MSRHTCGTQSSLGVQGRGVVERQPWRGGRLGFWGAGAADDAFRPRLGQPDHGAPSDAQHERRLVDEHLQLLGLAIGRGDVVDELELAVRLEQPGVRANGVDVDAVEPFGGRDQHVRHRSRRQFDHEIVDRIPRRPLDNVEGQDVGAHRAERHGQ